MMERILIRVEDTTMEADLRRDLGDAYDLINAGQNAKFDLAIVDEDQVSGNAQWIAIQKKRVFPKLLPFLLIVSPSSFNGDIDDECFDDVLLTPLRENELQMRVRSLLDMRRMSVMLADQQEKLISIGKALDSTSDAILIADVKGASVFHNRAFSELYEYSEKELTRERITDYLFASPSIALEVFQSVENGETWSGEVLLKSETGEMIPSQLRADRIEDNKGDPLGMICVFTNITERKHAEAREQEQRVLSNALTDIAVALNSTLDLDEVLKRILANLSRVVVHDAANIMLIEGDIARIVRHQGYRERGLDTANLVALRVKISNKDDLRQMIEGHKPFIVSDVRQSEWQSPLPADWLRSHVGVPIISKEHVIGFLHLDSQEPDYLSPLHVEWLQSFAESAAIAIRNAQLHQQAEELGALKERQRIARDLHDAVSQTLFSATVIAEALALLWEKNPQKVLPRLGQLHRLTKGALAEMRTLLMELRPDALLEAETAEVLEQLVEGILGRTRLKIPLDIALTETLPSEVHVTFYYITHEALNNIVKHADARHVTVTLKQHAEHVKLEIIDDGSGFDLQKATSTSMGLQIMQERAAAIGARLNIQSRIGAGTHIEVIWKENGNE
jgi:PAS domain S-box-containing protein